MAVSTDRRDSCGMVRAQAEQPSPEVLGSLMMFDEQRILLRATWRPLHGFFNISLWRDERVVETFHLTPDAATSLMAFFTRAFVSSLPAAANTRLRLVSSADASPATSTNRKVTARLREHLADSFEAAAQRLRA